MQPVTHVCEGGFQVFNYMLGYHLLNEYAEVLLSTDIIYRGDRANKVLCQYNMRQALQAVLSTSTLSIN